MKYLLPLILITSTLYGQKTFYYYVEDSNKENIKLKNVHGSVTVRIFGSLYGYFYFDEGDIVKVTNMPQTKTYYNIYNIKNNEKIEVTIVSGELKEEAGLRKDYYNQNKGKKSFKGKSASSNVPEGGIGLGLGLGGLSISLFYNANNYFGLIGGNIFNGRNEDNTYSFSPDLFDDDERGDIAETVWFVGGVEKVSSNDSKLFIGGGLSLTSRYFKRFDSMEILGEGDGVYYIEDDNGNSASPTVVLGMTNIMQSNNYGIKKYGIFVNLIPFDVSLMLVL